MNKLLLVFSFVLFFNSARSQDILDVITKDVCSCAESKKEVLQQANSQKLKMEIGICIISSISNHKEEVDAKYGDVLKADGGMEKLGGEVGLKMVGVCPDVLMALAESGQLDEYLEPVEEEYFTVEGRIVEIKTEQFLTVMVKDISGRNHTLLVLTFFEGSDILIEGKLKKNDKVSIEYWEQEFYDVKAKDFRYYKVIQGIKQI
ncbi:hypothetical protein AM493_04490 [Flavobacterium akiainvivens]|uniref:Uncharacterized protein n=1 Tax=Flavobacterium akiainvivens TaxID=1202724 RepID=A0A0N0RQH1_9FLAO|nr:hypothetical protein [Flavobacterium akiainvivens]KOS05372.1 hypothetical protein AM493_04490 [Flavobacterium akiainvivens]SFQ73889.1 hypothetical protein SAMN05444144_11952 [Flavobacterium akiainvivens]